VIIRVQEDYAGDPCYAVDGHVDIDEFKKRLSAMSDYGEDEESARDYHYSYTFQVEKPDGSWKLVGAEYPGARAVTFAATWAVRIK
jgi:hypothetical protein